MKNILVNFNTKKLWIFNNYYYNKPTILFIKIFWEGEKLNEYDAYFAYGIKFQDYK